jgi:hypothetical protein
VYAVPETSAAVEYTKPPAPPPPPIPPPPPPPPATISTSNNGVVEGVTLFEEALSKLVPIGFVAVTLKVYAVPLESPVTVIGLDALVPVKPPGVEVAVYEVIVLPPVPFAVNSIFAVAFPKLAAPIVGACGTVPAVAVVDATDTDEP